MCTDITEIIRKIFRKTSIFNFKKFFFSFHKQGRKESKQNENASLAKQTTTEVCEVCPGKCSLPDFPAY